MINRTIASGVWARPYLNNSWSKLRSINHLFIYTSDEISKSMGRMMGNCKEGTEQI